MFSFRNPELEALYLAILVAGGEGQIQRIATKIQRKDPENKNEILGSSSILNANKSTTIFMANLSVAIG